MSAVTCDFCETNLASGSNWVGPAKVDLCDECLVYLATHPRQRREFAEDLEDERQNERAGSVQPND